MKTLITFLRVLYQLHHYSLENNSNNLDIKVVLLLCKINTYIIHKDYHMQNDPINQLMSDPKKPNLSFIRKKIIIFDYYLII